MPPPVTASRLLTDIVFDPVAVALLLVAAVAYGAGVRRLARRGRRWPAGRAVSFAAGLVVLAAASLSGLARYDTVLFSMHVAQHLLLGMAAPLLLVLGAPVTLALQASDRALQVRLVRLLHTGPVRALTHPVAVSVVFSATLVILYFTGLYELSLRNGAVHTWVHLHFIVAGVLFFWVLVGVDPSPRPVPYWGRLVLVLLAVPVHAVLAVAILSSGEVLAGEWYGGLGRTWGVTPLADQRTGAALLWGVGDVLTLVAGAVVVVQWLAHDRRSAARADRRLDAAGDTGVRPGPARLLVAAEP